MSKVNVASLVERRVNDHFNHPLAGTFKHDDFLKRLIGAMGYSSASLNAKVKEAHGMTMSQFFWYSRVMAAGRRLGLSDNPDPAELAWYGYTDLHDLDLDLRKHRGLSLAEFRIRYRKAFTTH